MMDMSFWIPHPFRGLCMYSSQSLGTKRMNMIPGHKPCLWSGGKVACVDKNLRVRAKSGNGLVTAENDQNDTGPSDFQNRKFMMIYMRMHHQMHDM